MSGKIPDLKKLRKIIEESDLKSQASSNGRKTPSVREYDSELESALGTIPLSRTPVPTSYDLQLMNEIKSELDNLSKDLSRKEEDDLILSSESEDKIPSPFQLTLTSNASNKTKNSKTSQNWQNILKEKNLRIKQLEKVVANQKNQIENLKGQLNNSFHIERCNTEKSMTNSVLRQKEKELSDKLKDSEKKISELKRNNYRLQDLNNQLVEKVKLLETQHEAYDVKKEKKKNKGLRNSNKQLNKENCHLQHKVEEMNIKLQFLRNKYDKLVESSLIFEEKTRELYRVNQVLHQSLASLVPDLQLPNDCHA